MGQIRSGTPLNLPSLQRGYIGPCPCVLLGMVVLACLGGTSGTVAPGTSETPTPASVSALSITISTTSASTTPGRHHGLLCRQQAHLPCAHLPCPTELNACTV